jgi:hypothetical protein
MALATRVGRAQASGSVEGIVVGESGVPLSGAVAYARPVDRPMMGIVPHADTDETGHFVIRNLGFGLYSVFGAKEDEDYPGLTTGFYGVKSQRVRVDMNHPRSTVTVQLGPKAGVLYGTVTDAITGGSLNPCAELRVMPHPDKFVSGTGLVGANYRLLVPSGVDVAFKIWLAGYDLWYYPGVAYKAASTALHLQPGEEMTVNVQLQPRNDTNAGCGMPTGMEVIQQLSVTSDQP